MNRTLAVDAASVAEKTRLLSAAEQRTQAAVARAEAAEARALSVEQRVRTAQADGDARVRIASQEAAANIGKLAAEVAALQNSLSLAEAARSEAVDANVEAVSTLRALTAEITRLRAGVKKSRQSRLLAGLERLGAVVTGLQETRRSDSVREAFTALRAHAVDAVLRETGVDSGASTTDFYLAGRLAAVTRLVSAADEHASRAQEEAEQARAKAVRIQKASLELERKLAAAQADASASKEAVDVERARANVAFQQLRHIRHMLLSGVSKTLETRSMRVTRRSAGRQGGLESPSTPTLRPRQQNETPASEEEGRDDEDMSAHGEDEDALETSLSAAPSDPEFESARLLALVHAEQRRCFRLARELRDAQQEADVARVDAEAATAAAEAARRSEQSLALSLSREEARRLTLQAVLKKLRVIHPGDVDAATSVVAHGTRDGLAGNFLLELAGAPTKNGQPSDFSLAAGAARAAAQLAERLDAASTQLNESLAREAALRSQRAASATELTRTKAALVALTAQHEATTDLLSASETNAKSFSAVETEYRRHTAELRNAILNLINNLSEARAEAAAAHDRSEAALAKIADANVAEARARSEYEAERQRANNIERTRARTAATLASILAVNDRPSRHDENAAEQEQNALTTALQRAEDAERFACNALDVNAELEALATSQRAALERAEEALSARDAQHLGVESDLMSALDLAGAKRALENAASEAHKNAARAAIQSEAFASAQQGFLGAVRAIGEATSVAETARARARALAALLIEPVQDAVSALAATDANVRVVLSPSKLHELVRLLVSSVTQDTSENGSFNADLDALSALTARFAGLPSAPDGRYGAADVSALAECRVDIESLRNSVVLAKSEMEAANERLKSLGVCYVHSESEILRLSEIAYDRICEVNLLHDRLRVLESALENGRVKVGGISTPANNNKTTPIDALAALLAAHANRARHEEPGSPRRPTSDAYGVTPLPTIEEERTPSQSVTASPALSVGTSPLAPLPVPLSLPKPSSSPVPFASPSSIESELVAFEERYAAASAAANSGDVMSPVSTQGDATPTRADVQALLRKARRELDGGGGAFEE